MTDQELIHELKKAASRWEKENPIIGVGKLRYCDALRDAACRIAALQSENAELRKGIEQQTDIVQRW